MRRTGLLAAAAAMALMTAAPADGAWQQPSDAALDADRSAHARTTAAAVVGGVPHVAWTEGGGSAGVVHAARMRPDGTWEQLGALSTAGASAIEVDAEAIGGAFHVAWAEDPPGSHTPFQVHVARLTGTGFEPVGGIVNRQASTEARDPSLVDAGGVPHIAWTESDAQNIEVWVARLEDGAWKQIGGRINRSSRDAEAALVPSLVDQEGAFEPDLALVGGVLHVGFTEGSSSSGDVRVARFADGAWREYGADQPALGSAAIDVDVASVGGVPFAAWREASGRFLVRVARLDGSSWNRVGGGLDANAAAAPSLLDLGGRPWLGYVALGDDLRVVRLNAGGSDWEEPVAAPLDRFGGSQPRTPSLVALEGIPWVAWSEAPAGLGHDVRVSRLVPDVLSTEADAGATSATVSARLRTYGLSYPAGFAYGPAGSELSGRTAMTAAAGEEATIAAVLSGLEPRTDYEARAVAVAGPEVHGPAVAFRTTKRNGKD